MGERASEPLPTARRADSLLSLRLRNKPFFQMFSQGRNFFGHDIPEDVFVNPEILMSNNVSKGSNFPPFDPGESFARLWRNAFGGFPDDFKISQDRIVGLLIGEKLVPLLTRHKTQNLVAGSMDILKEKLVVTRPGGRLVR